MFLIAFMFLVTFVTLCSFTSCYPVTDVSPNLHTQKDNSGKLVLIEEYGDGQVVYADRDTRVAYIGLARARGANNGYMSLSVRLKENGEPMIFDGIL